MLARAKEKVDQPLLSLRESVAQRAKQASEATQFK
jgi:hypothetical protein